MQLRITTQKEACVQEEAIYHLIIESFQQWTEYGLYHSYLSFERFQKIMEQATVFVAIDTETQELVGTHTISVNKKKNRAYGNLLAVLPKAKHKGIATKMLKYEEELIRKDGYDYLQENTAVPAFWSVNWHLKNGYRIIGYKCSARNNHYTYVFRKQLSPSLFWSGPLAPITARLHFMLSYTVTRLCKTSTGQLTLLGRIGKKVRDKVKKKKETAKF